MDKKISIVMAYYNRRKLLYNTLKTIEHSKYSDKIEVIIVDDASDKNNRIEDLSKKIKLDLNIIRIEQNDKWWMNPCIPYNIGFKNVKNDIIIIQNPECLHFGEIIEYTLNNIKDGIYLSFGAYSIDEYNTNLINKLNFDNLNLINQIGKIIYPLKNGPLLADGTNAWYNHSIHRPLMLHFCNAIMKKDLEDLGGFDERYGSGFAWDDNEFIWRIQNVKKMNTVIVDKPFVIHQFHGVSNYVEKQSFFVKNSLLYKNIKNDMNFDIKKNNQYYK